MYFVVVAPACRVADVIPFRTLSLNLLVKDKVIAPIVGWYSLVSSVCNVRFAVLVPSCVSPLYVIQLITQVPFFEFGNCSASALVDVNVAVKLLVFVASVPLWLPICHVNVCVKFADALVIVIVVDPPRTIELGDNDIVLALGIVARVCVPLRVIVPSTDVPVATDQFHETDFVPSALWYISYIVNDCVTLPPLLIEIDAVCVIPLIVQLNVLL